MELRFFIAKLFINGFLDTHDAAIDKGFEIAGKLSESFLIGSEFSLSFQTVEFFQVEDLFDEKEYLDQPVLTELPIAKVAFKL